MRLTELQQELEQPFPDPALLRKAADFGIEALPSLVPHVHANPAAIEAATTILSEMSPLDWLAVKERLERAVDCKLPGGWKPGILLEASLPLTAVLCLHRNGYLREEALRRLRSAPFAFPILAAMLNDHVPQVRATARLALEAFPHEVRPEWLAVARHVAQGQREDHGWLARSLMSRLGDERLREAAESGSKPVRRAAWEALLLRYPPEVVIEGALRDPDPGLKLWAGKLAREHPVSDRLLRRMLASRIPRLRRDALETLKDRDIIEQCLLDPSPMVQEAAARLSPGVNLAQFYRDHLEEHPKACLIGLRRLGSKRDYDLVLPHADRRLGLETLARLDPQRARPLLEALLQDERPGMRRQAFFGLRPLAGQLDPRELWSRLDDRNARDMLHLIRLASKWEGVVYLLRATHAWPEAAQAELKLWLKTYNQRQITPAAEQLEAFRRERHEARLPNGLKRDLEGI